MAKVRAGGEGGGGAETGGGEVAATAGPAAVFGGVACRVCFASDRSGCRGKGPDSKADRSGLGPVAGGGAGAASAKASDAGRSDGSD